jgi:hypothetical protein
MRAPLGWAPWVLFGAFGALVAVVGALAIRGTVRSASLGPLVFAACLALVGALIAARRPGNAIGWLCLGVALAGGSQVAAQSYATYGLIADPGSLPGAQFAAWWSGWIGTPGVFFQATLLPLLFPTGRPPSPRWRPLLWLVLTTIVVGILYAAFSPGPLLGASEFVNPMGLEILGRVTVPLGAVLIGLFFTSVLLCAASLFARYRQARGPERQQLKWFFFAFLLVIGTLLIGIALGALLIGDPTVRSAAVPPSLYDAWWSVVFPATTLTIPIAIGIAVLRYRLYDIDLLINRTLVYGSLTAVLVFAYVAGVAAFQFLLSPFTSGSPIAVAVSTLAVVALFQPLRRRFQTLVDRRFYRERYDAERTLDTFTARLREQIDLASLERELVGVVNDTMQPAHASVWLRRAKS